jgi:hypothetical protein
MFGRRLFGCPADPAFRRAQNGVLQINLPPMFPVGAALASNPVTATTSRAGLVRSSDKMRVS